MVAAVQFNIGFLETRYVKEAFDHHSLRIDGLTRWYNSTCMRLERRTEISKAHQKEGQDVNELEAKY